MVESKVEMKGMNFIGKRYITLLFGIVCFSVVLPGESFTHPRLFISEGDWQHLPQKLEQEPYASWLEMVKAGVHKQVAEDPGDRPQYPWAYSASNSAFIYAATGKQEWASIAWQQVDKLIHDQQYTHDPMSFGLTRAAILQGMVLAYDFAYHGWTKEQQQQANRAKDSGLTQWIKCSIRTDTTLCS